MPRWITSWVVLIVLAAPQVASGGGFAVARFGGEQGHPATDHPTAIYFNPAGLALGTGLRIYGEGVFAFRTLSYDRPVEAINNVLEPGETGAGTPADAVATNSGEASLTNMLASPFFGVVADLGVPNLAIGAAVYAPFGGQAEWDENEEFEGSDMYPGAVDGVQRWSTIDGELRSLYFTLAGAYRLPGPRLSFGVGLNLIRSSILTVRARNAPGTDDLITDTGNLIEGRSLIDVSGTHLSASAGVTWQPMTELTIGASYQSQPGFGTMTQSGTLVNKLGATPALESNIDLEQQLPDIVRLGAAYRATPDLELRLSGDYQRWSVFENQCLLDGDDPDANCDFLASGAPGPDAAGIVVNIPRNWKDTYSVRAGGSYWLNPAFEINTGLVFDSSAVPDEYVDASLIDMNKVIAIAGLRYALMSQQLILGLTLNNVFYFQRTVEPRERDDDGNQIGPEPPSAVPDGAGTYKQNIFFVNAAAEYRF